MILALIHDLIFDTALPFLANTQTFLWYPTVIISGLWCLSVIMVLCGLRINLSRVIMAFHYG